MTLPISIPFLNFWLLSALAKLAAAFSLLAAFSEARRTISAECLLPERYNICCAVVADVDAYARTETDAKIFTN